MLVRVPAVTCIALAACGRIGFDATDASTRDTSPDALEVLVLEPPFGTPTPITDLNTPNALEDDPTLTQDQLEIFFTSSRAGGVGGTDIWTSTRSSVTAPWLTPRNIGEINTAQSESNAAISPDGLTLVFGSGALGDQDLVVTTRSTRADIWNVPIRLDTLSSTGAHDFGASFTDSTDVLYFSSARTGNLALYVARGTAPNWSSPMLISELDTPQLETSPFSMRNEDVLWFGSDRAGTAGGQDIWVAVRDTAAGPFGAPIRVTELATTGDDSDPYLSPDGHTIYFSRTGANGTDLMIATR